MMPPDFSEVGSADAVLSAFRSSPALALVLEGADLVVVAANDAAHTLLPGRRLLGQPWATAVPEAGPAGLLALASRVRQRAEPLEARDWRFELEEDGERIERFLDLQLTPWCPAGTSAAGSSGAVRGVILTAVDTTENVHASRRADDRNREASRRYAGLRELSVALQDTLLPDGLPVLPGLQTAGSYLLAEEDLEAGGDWLDVVPRGDGRAALVVGDVVGHGVEASAAMGQLRAVCEERLSTGADLAEVMAALDRYADRQPAAHAATVAIVDLDPATGELSYCTAGHPPPLVLDEEDTRFLAPSGAGPLGTSSRFELAKDVLAEEAMLLLYTDGVIERPGRKPARATVELAQVASSVAARADVDPTALTPAVDRVCRETLQRLTGDTGYADDITLLVGRRQRPARKLRFETQATVDTLRQVRARLASWFAPLHPTMLDQMALQHAIGEVVTNVVEHAYPPDETDRPVCISLELERGGTAVARIEDHGRWRHKADRGPGARGLTMVSGLMDEMYIERGDDHTTVTMRHRLSRALSMLTGVSTGPAEGRWSDYSSEFVGAELHVSGVVDLATSERLRRDLLAFTIDSLGRAVVDLSGVDLLASAGVQVLTDGRLRALRQGVDLRFRVAQGTVAQHVLHLTGLEAEIDVGSVDVGSLPPL